MPLSSPRCRLFAALVLLTLLVATPDAHGAPGDLDPSFGVGGLVRTSFGDWDGYYGAADVAAQANGKIVAVGGSAGAFAVVRYNSDGSLDSTFSSDGKQTTDFPSYGGSSGEASGVAIQPDGKIVAAGSISDIAGCPTFAVARYNSDGSLDVSFGTNGRTISFGPTCQYEADVALQADGKIVVAGGYEGEFTVVRFTAAGVLDASFSEDGRQVTPVDDAWNASGQAVAIQSDGKIVVAGDGFTLVRYNSDGSLDSSFSDDGILDADFAAMDLAIQPDGKFVVAGGAGMGDSDSFALARFNLDGSPDTTFSEDGVSAISIRSGYDGARSLVLQPDGKLMVTGVSYTSDTFEDGQFAVARFNPDGSPDNSFSADGRTTADFGMNAAGSAVAVQPDGAVVVGGVVIADGGVGVSDFALARYQGGGDPITDPNPRDPTDPAPRDPALTRDSSPPVPPSEPPSSSSATPLLSGIKVVRGKRYRVRFHLSAADWASMILVLRKGGVRSGKHCVKPKARQRRGRRCDLQVAYFAGGVLPAGTHTYRLPKRLKPGAYRVTLGSSRQVVRADFRVRKAKAQRSQQGQALRSHRSQALPRTGRRHPQAAALGGRSS